MVKQKKTTKPKTVKSSPVKAAKQPTSRWLWLALILALVVGAWVYHSQHITISKVSDLLSLTKPDKKAGGGEIISQELVRNYSVQEVAALSKQNYGHSAPAPKYPVSERLIKYRSQGPSKEPVDVYARVYLPRVQSANKVPLISFAPGTTGIGDQCAASLEQPALTNWGNYKSHMATYAGQGYGIVITDYEGMRDANRIHHYMSGETEGKAMLDAAKAVYNLKDNSIDTQVFLAGYSQGGQAAAWADQISGSYAPSLNIKGVVAFAPVSDVTTTLEDIARGAQIVWFGPFILTSYGDQYGQTFPLSQILQPKFTANLKTDVLGHCINSVKYWPDANSVYTPQFLQAMKDNNIAAISPDLAADMAENQAWDVATPRPKLINQGDKDTIILPDQQTKALPLMCQAGHGPVQLKPYAAANHYSLMVYSFRDTVTWMNKVMAGDQLPSSCPATGGGGA